MSDPLPAKPGAELPDSRPALLRRLIGPDPRNLLLAAGFFFVLALAEEIAFKAPMLSYLSYQYGLSVPRFFLLVIPVFLAANLAVIHLLRVSLSASRPWIRVTSALILSLAFLVEYGYQSVLARFAVPDDVAAVLDATADNWRDMLRDGFAPAALLPAALFAALLWHTRTERHRGPRHAGAAFGLVAALTFMIWPFASSGPESTSIGAFLRSSLTLPLELDWPWYFRYSAPRLEVATVPGAAPRNNVIFVIDESVRADHLSVNGYGRRTTPTLEQLSAEGRLLSWEKACAASTSSYASNASLLTGVSELPDVSFRTRINPTIFQYAKAAGYRTAYYSGQIACYPEEFSRGDMKHVDDFAPVTAFRPGPGRDFDIVARIRERLAASSGWFIVVQKQGIHFHYNNAFPESEAPWQPVLKTPHYETEPVALRNSYDNAVLYNVDGFFRELTADRALLENTTILYTADHGETLCDNGETNAHGGTTRNEAMVPLILVAGRPRPADTGYAAGHRNVFATLLDLMQVPTGHRVAAYGRSLFEGRAEIREPRHYLVGGLHGRGSGKQVYHADGRRLAFDDPSLVQEGVLNR